MIVCRWIHMFVCEINENNLYYGEIYIWSFNFSFILLNGNWSQ